MKNTPQPGKAYGAGKFSTLQPVKNTQSVQHIQHPNCVKFIRPAWFPTNHGPKATFCLARGRSLSGRNRAFCERMEQARRVSYDKADRLDLLITEVTLDA